MSGGSQQLRVFRRAVSDGLSVECAALSAGITIGEARLIVADDLRKPPQPDDFELLGPAKMLVKLCGPWGRVL